MKKFIKCSALPPSSTNLRRATQRRFADKKTFAFRNVPRVKYRGIERIKIGRMPGAAKPLALNLRIRYIIGTAVSTEENRAGRNAPLGALSRRSAKSKLEPVRHEMEEQKYESGVRQRNNHV